ncbi:MAG: dephospho-CoA kinase [Planctomycetales bacterium]
MSDRESVPVIGLVGGVGSGKSSIARLLAKNESIVLIDGDRAGHHVLKRPDVIRQLQHRFGEGILDEHRQIRRGALAREVFGPGEAHHRAKADLELIVHPRIREILETEIDDARANPEVAAILLDAAVLFEAGWNDLCDAVVYIDTPRPSRLERVRAARGWDEAELDRREASQLPLETKRSRADHVIDNSGPPERAAAELEGFLKSLSFRRELS